MTFNQYVTQCRVIHAEQLLKDTNTRISEIAQEVGFSDEEVLSLSLKNIIRKPLEIIEK